MEHISYKQGRRLKGFVPYVSSVFFAVAHSHFERTTASIKPCMCIRVVPRWNFKFPHHDSRCSSLPFWENCSGIFSYVFPTLALWGTILKIWSVTRLQILRVTPGTYSKQWCYVLLPRLSHFCWQPSRIKTWIVQPLGRRLECFALKHSKAQIKKAWLITTWAFFSSLHSALESSR